MNATTDALAPSSMRESIAFLSTLKHPLNKKWWALVLALHGLMLLAMVLNTTVLGRTVDVLQGNSVPPFGAGSAAATKIIAAVIACLFVEALFRVLAKYVIGKRLYTIAVDLRRTGVSAVLATPIPKLMRLGTGNIVTRLGSDIDDFVGTFQMIGSRLIIAVMLLPFSAVAMVLIHPVYALAVLVTVLLAWFPVRMLVRYMPATANAVAVTDAKRNAAQLDILRGLKTIQHFRFQKWALQRFERRSWNTVHAEAKSLSVSLRALLWAQACFATLLVSTILLGIFMVHHGYLTAGEATAAIMLVVRVVIQLFNVMFFISEIQSALTSLGRTVALSTLSDKRSLPTPPDFAAPVEISLEDVSFGYRGEQLVLEGIDLRLAEGSTTALVGTSGAGKSTLAALIAGMLHPTSGVVKVGTYDLNTVAPDWVAQNITLVNQESHVFSGTLRDDLRMANASATDEELFAALAEAGLSAESPNFRRSFPQGLDTLIGAGNSELSPQVVQHIALARVVLKQPQVVLLDEATSEAGSSDAQNLEDAVQRLVQGRTALLVVHRMDQVMFADRILVMEHGRIVEDGTHDELLALDGRYAALFRRWRGGEHIEM